MDGITIKKIIEENSKKYAAKNALLRKIGKKWVGITYTELFSQVNELGTSLVKLGMKKGDRIALLTHNCPEWAISYLAIVTHNGIVVPVDKELKAQELRHILEDSGSKFIIVTEELLPKIEEIYQSLKGLEKIILITDPTRDVTIPDDIKDDMKKIEKAWQSLIANIKKDYEKEIKRIEVRWLSLEKKLKDARINKNGLVIEKRNRFLDFTKGLYEGADVSIDVVHFENLFGGKAPVTKEMGYEDTIAILYTSGTTGRSKGVMLTNENIITNFRGVKELMQVDDTILTLSVLPINHVYESTCGVLIPILLGGTVAFAESLLKVAQNLNEVRPNFFLGVPALYQALYTRMSQKVNSSLAGRIMNSNSITRKVIQKKIKSELGGSDIAFISGGGPFDPSLQEGLRKLGLNIFNGYGITETAPLVAVNSVVGGDRLGSVGKVMPGVEIKIDSPNEKGEGEIFIKGPNVMKGYFNNAKATREVLTDGWYHSGDLGYLDDDNYLFVLGRVKNLIVTGKGKNIYPEEVEAELEHSPFIEEAMVYAHNLGTTDEEVRAVVYLSQDMLEAHAVKEGKKELEKSEVHTLIRDEIKRCCSNLADYKRVKEFMIRDEEFPKTSTRKIKRYAVEEAIKVN
jgi:long-chain acyl-CoA synthetase